MAGSTSTPEFFVTGTDGATIATFTIAADGQVMSVRETVAEMVASMMQARGWTPGQAKIAFTHGWSNAYLSIRGQQ